MSINFIKQPLFLVIVSALFLGLFAFQNHEGNKVKEHLSITIEYERNCQLLYLSDQTGVEKRIAFFDLEIRAVHNWLRKPALENKGFQITEVSFKSKGGEIGFPSPKQLTFPKEILFNLLASFLSLRSPQISLLLYER